jgi:hypothetical protein
MQKSKNVPGDIPQALLQLAGKVGTRGTGWEEGEKRGRYERKKMEREREEGRGWTLKERKRRR